MFQVFFLIALDSPTSTNLHLIFGDKVKVTKPRVNNAFETNPYQLTALATNYILVEILFATQ